MKNYDEYRKEVGYYDIIDMPKQFKYYAYKLGECVIFDSLPEAQKFSKNTEKVCVNKDEFDANREEFQVAEGLAQSAWIKDLREEYSSLSDAVFAACYSEAYEDGHSAGYDEVRNCMYSVVEFAEKILTLK